MQNAWRSRCTCLAIALCVAGGCGQSSGDDDSGAAGMVASHGSGGAASVPHDMNPSSGSGGAPASSGSGGQGSGGHMSASGAGGTMMMPMMPSASGGSAAPAMPDAGMHQDPAGDPMRLAISAKAVPSGGEDHICVTLAAPNAEVGWVTSIHATLTVGSHHLIVDRAGSGAALQTKAASCPPTMGGDGSRLIIAQQRDTVLDTPENTAFRLEPHEPIFLQLHYINLADKPVNIEGAVELQYADPSAGTPIEVQSLFTGATSISLAAGQPGTAESFMIPQAGPDLPLRLFALTSHTHSLGIDATIERVASQDAPDTTPLHESLDWHEPPLTTFDPPLVFSGDDGLRLRCKYQNTTDHDVHFGTRFEDEMCFMWMYFYRR
jgi:hypothetical protein